MRFSLQFINPFFKNGFNKRKVEVKIDSAASSGGQGRLTSLGLRLRQHCQFQIFISYSLAAYDLLISECSYPASTVSRIFNVMSVKMKVPYVLFVRYCSDSTCNSFSQVHLVLFHSRCTAQRSTCPKTSNFINGGIYCGTKDRTVSPFSRKLSEYCTLST